MNLVIPVQTLPSIRSSLSKCSRWVPLVMLVFQKVRRTWFFRELLHPASESASEYLPLTAVDCPECTRLVLGTPIYLQRPFSRANTGLVSLVRSERQRATSFRSSAYGARH